MDAVTLSYSKFVKQYDRKLYAVRTPQGMIQIWREGDRPDASLIPTEGDHVLRPNPQFILALTDTWTLSGSPVEWGKEPLREMIRSMDTWNQKDYYESMVKNRENEQREKDRIKSNEMRAIASELRSDFAKATNDIVVKK